MKIIEAYIAKDDIKKYVLHEAMQTGYNMLYELFSGKVNSSMSDDEIISSESNIIIDEEIPFKVMINKDQLKPFIDYFITLDGTMLFVKNIEKGSIIKIYDTSEKTQVVTKSPYNKNALISLFSNNQKIKYNNEYFYKLNINEKEYNLNFEAEYNPYYSNVTKIRSDMGEVINNIKDSKIARLIYLHSKEVYKVIMDNEKLDELSKSTYAQDIVRYRTCIDLCWLLYYEMAFNYGSVSKLIGTIKVEKTVKIVDIEIMLKRFGFLLNQTEGKLNDNFADGIKLLSYVDYMDYTYKKYEVF